MGKRAKIGVKPAVTTTVNPTDAKVVKGRRGRLDRPKKAGDIKKRNNVKTRSTTKQVKKDKASRGIAPVLRKDASIQANSKERRVLTKVFEINYFFFAILIYLV